MPERKLKLHPTYLGRAILCAALGYAAVSAAQPGDPLQTPACLAAQQQLKVQEELTARERSHRPALDAARRQVGVICLRAPDAPPRVVRAPAAPVDAGTSTPITIRRSTNPTVVVPAVPRAPPPLSVTSCDALGCWANDGTRLQRAGPGLLGPRGYCSTAGAALSCP
jgi:hypothetical protein